MARCSSLELIVQYSNVVALATVALLAEQLDIPSSATATLRDRNNVVVLKIPI